MTEEQKFKMEKINEAMNTPFAQIKFAIASIQFNHLSMNEEKTAIEANPSTHRIAKYVFEMWEMQQKEIERLKGTIKQAFDTGHHIGGNEYYHEQDWNKFKTENNL